MKRHERWKKARRRQAARNKDFPGQCSMKIPFNTPARRWLVAVVAWRSCARIRRPGRNPVCRLLVGKSSRIELTSLNRAAWLDPGNADYRNRLGRYYDIVSRDPASAVGQYRAAVQLNPHSARYWFDLASAYQVLGDTLNQTTAMEHAIQADSMTPDVAWQAANLYLVQGENEKALREFRVVLANDATLAAAAIQFCWRIQPDVDVLSARRRAYPPGTLTSRSLPISKTMWIARFARRRRSKH